MRWHRILRRARERLSQYGDPASGHAALQALIGLKRIEVDPPPVSVVPERQGRVQEQPGAPIEEVAAGLHRLDVPAYDYDPNRIEPLPWERLDWDAGDMWHSGYHQDRTVAAARRAGRDRLGVGHWD